MSRDVHRVKLQCDKNISGIVAIVLNTDALDRILLQFDKPHAAISCWNILEAAHILNKNFAIAVVDSDGKSKTYSSSHDLVRAVGDENRQGNQIELNIDSQTMKRESSFVAAAHAIIAWLKYEGLVLKRDAINFIVENADRMDQAASTRAFSR